MRLLFGIMLGALLTVASAYIYDSSHAPGGAAPSAQRPLVNWDVVNVEWGHLTDRARVEWNKLRATSRDS
jgi:hypothetical protein